MKNNIDELLVGEQPPIEELKNHTDIEAAINDLIKESDLLTPEEAEIKKIKAPSLSPEENAKRNILREADKIQSPEDDLIKKISLDTARKEEEKKIEQAEQGEIIKENLSAEKIRETQEKEQEKFKHLRWLDPNKVKSSPKEALKKEKEDMSKDFNAI